MHVFASAVMPAVPRKAEVIFCFGEIDCREGLLVAVEKCRYEARILSFSLSLLASLF
jgi:hypothetical protein